MAVLHRFGNLSIRQKLVVIILLTSSTALALASASFMTYDWMTSQRNLKASAHTLADLISFTSSAAVTFDDPKAATKTLSAFSLRRVVLASAIYSKDGKIFADYRRKGFEGEIPPYPGPIGETVANRCLVLYQPMMLDHQRIGTIYLQMEMSEVYDRLEAFTGIVAVVLLGGTILAFVVSFGLQRVISEPIRSLARTAKLVSEKKDYTARAVKTNQDEVGDLIDGFNEMLAQIEARDSALRARELILRLFVEHTPTAVAMFDREMRYRVASLRWLADYGLENQNVIGKPHYEVYPNTPERWKEIHRRCLEGAIEHCDEDPFPRPDGSTDWIRWEARPWRTGDGQIGGIIVFTEVITARKLAEEALRESQQRTKLMVQNTPLGVVVWSPERKVLEWNKSAERIFGYTEAEAIGQTAEFIVAENVRPHVNDIFNALFSKNGGETSINENLTKDGRTVTCTWYNASLVAPDGKVFAVASLVEDITERMRAEAEIRRLNAELEQRVDERTRELQQAHAQLVETAHHAGMAEIATSVLHNIGNVLTSVKASIGVLNDKLRSSRVVNVPRVAQMIHEHAAELGPYFTADEKGRHLPEYLTALGDYLSRENALMQREFQTLQHNIEHIQQIVGMQQSYAGVTGFTETLSIVDLIEDALRINAAGIERHGIAIVREFESVPRISIEKHRALQILVNLFSNAKYAMAEKEGGRTLTIRVLLKDENRIEVQVADTGIGIPPENMKHLFHYGFTTRLGGHGFGLHSSALAAQELGGSLSATSAGKGQGATFILELPLQFSGRSRRVPIAP